MAEDQQKVDNPTSDGSGATAVAEPVKKQAPVKRKPKKLPPFKVLLHNDAVNHFDHVIRSIMQLTPLSEQEAILRTIEAHKSGVALLLTTHKERAELYVDQFTSLGISLSMEPA